MRELAPFPAPQLLAAVDVVKVIKCTSRRKASGADGWAYAEMKDWPLELVELVGVRLRNRAADPPLSMTSVKRSSGEVRRDVKIASDQVSAKGSKTQSPRSFANPSPGKPYRWVR